MSFYGQAVSGQLSILMKRKPIERVIDDPATPAAVRDKLRLALEVRAFAETELGLPVGDAYASYADIGRDFVVYNVFVAPEFSVELESYCFPVAGCVTYRGYFSERDAVKAAQAEADSGKDVYVGRVAAYSTLGWFADPILNTFINRSDTSFAALLIHELAHRAVYLPGDTTFNESFATAVEQAGLERWLDGRDNRQAFADYLESEQKQREVVRLIVEARDELRDVYDGGFEDARLRAQKDTVFDRLRSRYGQLGQDYPFAAWMATPLNNAKLGTVAEYNEWVPAFISMMKASPSFQHFLEEVEALASKDKPERDAILASRALPPPPQ